MKNPSRLPVFDWLPLLLILFLLPGCTSTGDWREDSIFFSPRLAEQNLQRKRSELRREQAGTAAAFIEAASRRETLRNLRGSNRASDAEELRLRREIGRVTKEIAALDLRIRERRASGADAADLIEKRDLAQAENERLTALLYRILNSTR